MISRVWHEWTTHQAADRYEALLKEEVFSGIQNRDIHGLIDIQRLQAVVPEKARAMLSHFDEVSQHYEVRDVRRSG